MIRKVGEMDKNTTNGNISNRIKTYMLMCCGRPEVGITKLQR